MMQLNKTSLKNMQKIFTEAEDGLGVSEFLQLITTTIPADSFEDKIERIYGAITMFSDMDINGDGNMSWNELIQEIINQVESQTIKAKKDSETNKEISILEQIRTRDLLMVNEFVPVNKIDGSRHRKDLISAVYCPEL